MVFISSMWERDLAEQFFRNFSPEVKRLKPAVKRPKTTLPLLEKDVLIPCMPNELRSALPFTVDL